MKSREIRRAFTSFFEERGHEHVESGPLVPGNDPSLMFANAGMVQFKDVFTGKEKRDYARATSAQKCIRISGKHNDLENVGRTARHHTFFEMLGNFSFGDYFKREAIQFAWDFYTKVLKLPPERMVFTVFGGEEGYGPADTEAALLWKDVTGCGDDRIKHCNAKENFWQMGDTGPCGPCTEIHYCLGVDDVDPSTFGEEPTPEGRGWFELWNLVFMQFDRSADGTLANLPAPSVDTGAGLERAAVVMQDVLSNYDTDLLRPIVDLAGEIAGKIYGATQQLDDVGMRVIADHARTTAFLISEGIFPDKGGRSYVLRRVMRRAIRFGHQMGITEPFLHRCTAKVVELMGEDYPQLVEQKDLIADIAEDEEKRFRHTLVTGLEMIEKNDVWEEREGKRVLPGAVAGELYGTHGFPVDLTQQIGEERGFAVDTDGFAKWLEEERERSRGDGKLNDAVATEKVYYDIRELLGGSVEFLGYDTEEGTSEVVALLKDGLRVESLEEAAPPEDGVAPFEVVTKATPFYGEKGGQVGDAGELVLKSGDARFVVQDTQIPVDGLTVHRGYLKQGSLKVGDELDLRVSSELRSATRRNHSATHLLHWALREVVGPTVTQKGSLVGPDRLRFDYSATKPLDAEQIRKVEDLVNAAVLANSDITTEVLPMDEAKARGAIGIFEEKYGDVVRVLRIGPSLELCGGTHAARTGDIGLVKVLSDGGLAAGVRRIEASTGLNALAHLRSVEGTLEETAALLKAPRSLTAERVQKLQDELREKQREIEKLQKELMSGSGGRDPSADAKKVDDISVLGTTVPVGDPKALREIADQLRDKLAPAVVLLGAPSKDGKKALLVCSVSKDVIPRFKAGDIVKAAAAIVGGGGGGRPDFAQAGGSDPSKLGEAVAHVYQLTGAA